MEAVKCKSYAWRLKKILILCLKQIMKDGSQIQAMPLRVLEVFTELRAPHCTEEESDLYCKIIYHLVQNGEIIFKQF